MLKLYDHQLALSKYATRDRGLILYWPCGSGKTIGALYLAQLWRQRYSRIIVLTNATVKYQWACVMRDEFGMASQILDGQTPAGIVKSVDTVIVSYEILPYWIDVLLAWARDGDTLFIADEIHKLKAWKRQTKTVDQYGNVVYELADNIVGAAELLSRNVLLRVGLTATLLRDRRPDIWGQVDIIAPGELGTSWDFVHRYCGARKGEHGGLDVSGHTNTAELKGRLEKYIDKVTKEYIDQIMPPITRDTVYIDKQSRGLTKKEMDMQRRLGRGREAEIEDATRRKFGWLKEVLPDIISSGRVFISVIRKNIISDVAAVVAKVLPGVPVFTATGEDSIQVRLGIVSKVAALPEAVIIATLDSFAESIDGMQTINTVILLSLPDTEGDLIQFEGRFRRLGGSHNRIVFTVATNTIDERLLDNLSSKLEDYDRLLAEPDRKEMLGSLQLGGQTKEALLSSVLDDLKRGG